MFARETRVPVQQTQIEIQRMLDKAKAKQYGTAVDYDQQTARVQFRLHERVIRFTVALPDPNRFRGERFAKAERQKWRALMLVIKAKLESVESSIETFEEAFLANIVMPNDQTVAEIVIRQVAESYQTGRMPKALNPAPEEAR
jgi:hypothetical protein